MFFYFYLVDSLKDTNTETAEDLNDMMKQMDKEINEYDKISRSFKREEEDEDKPVNVELNLIENVLQSFKGQQGLPGPAGNLLKQFGIALPVDHEENDDDDNDDEWMNKRKLHHTVNNNIRNSCII